MNCHSTVTFNIIFIHLNILSALARWFSWLEHRPKHQKVWVRFPVRACNQVVLSYHWDAYGRQPVHVSHIDVSLSPSNQFFKKAYPPWLVWLSGLSVGLQIKGSLVQFPVGVHGWVSGHVPSRGRRRGNHTLMFLSLS